MRLTGSIWRYRRWCSPKQVLGGAGDPQAAEARMQALEGLTLVEAAPDAETLAQRVIDDAAIPRQAVDDAAHIAIAVTNAIEFLVT